MYLWFSQHLHEEEALDLYQISSGSQFNYLFFFLTIHLIFVFVLSSPDFNHLSNKVIFFLVISICEFELRLILLIINKGFIPNNIIRLFQKNKKLVMCNQDSKMGQNTDTLITLVQHFFHLLWKNNLFYYPLISIDIEKIRSCDNLC